MSEFVTPPPMEPGDRVAVPHRRAGARATRHASLSWVNPDAPIALGLDWGHTTPIAPLPLGGRVRLDPGDRTVQFE